MAQPRVGRRAQPLFDRYEIGPVWMDLWFPATPSIRRPHTLTFPCSWWCQGRDRHLPRTGGEGRICVRSDRCGWRDRAQWSGTRAGTPGSVNPGGLRALRQGNPDNASIPHWPNYVLAERATLILSRECRVDNDYGGRVRTLWKSIVSGAS